MSSLSYENLFSPDAGDRTEGQTRSASGRLPAPWNSPLTDAIAAEGSLNDASPWSVSTLRRGIDVAVAGTALIILMPAILIAAILVRLGSPGPIFFRQRRMGRNGREFTLYKFRSMKFEETDGASITVMGDSRITPVGAFLRRYKLDELPQFWNVLRGDMGLVGPRPKLPHHEALCLTCRPGITGVATLAFHKEEEFLSAVPEDELEAFYELFVKPAKAQMDLEYMRTATLGTDLKILWRTVATCLFSSRYGSTGPEESIAQYAVRRSAPERVTFTSHWTSHAGSDVQARIAGANREA